MKNLRNTITGLFAACMVAMVVPLFADTYPTQEEMEKQEKLAFVIGVEMNRTKETVLNLAQNNQDVAAAYDRFSKALIQGYDTKHFSEEDVKLINNAVTFSAFKHKEQKRKDVAKTPYIVHPISVANNIMIIGGILDKDVIIAALLHDTIEDTATTLEEIHAQFGETVKGYVAEVSDDKSLPFLERKKQQILHAPHKSIGAAQIKLADKLNNLQSIHQTPPVGWDQQRMNTYFLWAQEVVDNLPQGASTPLKHAVDQQIRAHFEA